MTVLFMWWFFSFLWLQGPCLCNYVYLKPHCFLLHSFPILAKAFNDSWWFSVSGAASGKVFKRYLAIAWEIRKTCPCFMQTAIKNLSQISPWQLTVSWAMKSSGQRTRSQAPCHHEPNLRHVGQLSGLVEILLRPWDSIFFSCFGKIVDSDFKIQTFLHLSLFHNGIVLLAPLFSRLWQIIVADTNCRLYQECGQQD